ncbi:glutamine synthetase/guanido kinase [Macrolepiota fuliginosa MF-IS2]|uniref:Glutamine synthetase n=1 Tax=Macrolepiota fuliginosa MF-IS2 TaxID=1400762 RepID=A0A9P6C3T1_9AGAR|nr:glutamine synthetase/guanido kinase [Macrolepiota fuliginosa MF-IS2]
MSTHFIDTSHGVLYTPSSVSSQAVPTIQWLKDAGIKYVRVQWVDLVNNVRLRVLPVSYFEELMLSPRPGLGVAEAALGLIYGNLAEGFGVVGEYLYVPDLLTARLCPYSPGHASVLGWFEEKAPYRDAEGKLAVKSLICPRTKLKDIVLEAADAGVEFLVGFESEFILLESTNPIRTANTHQWSGSRGISSGLIEAQVLEEIVDSLIQSGIKVEIYHPELAPGQYEIVTGPLPPLEAADALVHTRESIMNTAARHKLHATFAPRVTMTSCGSATHAHISVHKTGHQKPIDTLSGLEASFLAGILDDLPALPGITLPIPASYKRVGDGLWSGGTYVAWGTENRECPIRLSNATSPGSRNFEMRFIDGTASPYLVLAGILGLGYAGIKSERRLTIENVSGPEAPAQLSEEERRKMGITQRMPLTWEEGRENLAQNEALRNIFGCKLLEKYLAVNKVLKQSLSIDDPDEEKAMTRLVELY